VGKEGQAAQENRTATSVYRRRELDGTNSGCWSGNSRVPARTGSKTIAKCGEWLAATA
jgi:hypothetical protein